MSRTFVIAEAGSCHDSSFANALHLVQTAKQAGADACKFQYWSSAKRLAERRRAEAYFPVYDRYQIPDEWLPKLAQECRSCGIEFMCTTYLPEDIDVVAPYVERFKVASFEAEDEAFVRAHLRYGKSVIVSTGMMNEPPEWLLRDGVKLLHCVSAYPTPHDQASLRAVEYCHGYSDHTKHIFTGAFAVCVGASVLEVHFRLNDTDPANPDYGTALTPAELGEYVALVRQAEVMLGDGVKKPQPAEADMMRYKVRPV